MTAARIRRRAGIIGMNFILPERYAIPFWHSHSRS
jgi:hypothetical protein